MCGVDKKKSDTRKKILVASSTVLETGEQTLRGLVVRLFYNRLMLILPLAGKKGFEPVKVSGFTQVGNGTR